jgi:hypothetical protein
MINDKVELLLKEYEDRREENAWHTQRYHKQSNFTYLYASAIIAIAGVLSSSEDLRNTLTALHISGESLKWFYLVLLSLAAMIGYYLFSSTLDALFMLFVNGIRAGVIEKLINAEAKEDILIWNSKILNHFFDSRLIRVNSWIKPPVLVTAWIFLFFLATNGLLCFLCYLMTEQFFYPYTVAIAVFTVFHIYQLFSLNTIGAPYIWSFITRISGLEGNSSATTADSTPSAEVLDKAEPRNYWVPFATVMLGFLPMALLSLQTNSFWPMSPHPFPFLLNISASVGDLILIPIFNYYFYKLVASNVLLIKQHPARFVLLSVLLLVASTYSQYLIHSSWLSDTYTGYMDLRLGQLSMAGWWHLGFASFETTIVLLYLVTWFVTRNDRVSFTLALSGWKFFSIYICIGVVDLVVQLLTAFRDVPLAEILVLQWHLAIRIALVLSIFFLSKRRLRLAH